MSRPATNTGARGLRGFTLVESLVGLAIVSLIMSALGLTTFQLLGTEKGIVEEGVAVSELRRGLGWFSDDAEMARTVSLADGGTASNLTLSWTNEYGGASTAHTATYALNGRQLIRSYDGHDQVVADRLLSVTFSRTGRSITATAVADSGLGDSRTFSLASAMRTSA